MKCFAYYFYLRLSILLFTFVYSFYLRGNCVTIETIKAKPIPMG